MTYPFLLILTALFMIPGVFLVFLPMLPAIPYMFAVALVFALFDHFAHVSLSTFGILGGIVALSFLIDHGSGIIGAKYGGASRKAIIGGLIGLVLGFLFFPPFGSFAGLFIGVFVVEFLQNRKRKDALRAATGAFLGSVTGVGINFFSFFFFGEFFWVLISRGSAFGGNQGPTLGKHSFDIFK